MANVSRPFWLLTLLLVAPLTACTQEAEPTDPVSHVEGTITVNAAIDSTRDYSGIEVIVTDGTEGGPDTLGYAVTNVDGQFVMDVAAADRGVFPLVLKRGAAVLNVSQLVVAPDDTVTVTAELPLGQRLPMIKSYENAAWLAFRNAEAAHSDRVSTMLAEGTASQEELGRSIVLSSEILWSIRSAYPGSMAADVASAKSVVMLDGWNDSLLVERVVELDPAAPGFAESAQAAGRAETRLHGLESGLSLLSDLRDMAENPEAKAAIQREIAQAHLDIGNQQEAIAAAESLETAFPDSDWSRWAQRAQYEANNLLPGLPAPTFSMTTRDGALADLEVLSGRYVVLEFWSPRDRLAAEQLGDVRQIVASDGFGLGLVWVSAALEPDDDLYAAFFEGRDVPGMQIRDSREAMQDLISRYNVTSLPTRYLIGPDGNIVDRYIGDLLLQLSADLENMAAG